LNSKRMDAATQYTQYNIYVMKPLELILTTITAMGACFAVGYLFYENIIISSIFSFGGILYIPIRKKELLRKRKEALTLQFKDLLYFVSVSLTSGKSLETALIDSRKAIAGIYPDPDSDILTELEIIHKRLLFNEPVEKIFYDFAVRSGIDDIKNFADVIIISKRAGANLVEVIKNTSATIREKVEMRQEIDNLIAGKKLEQKVLCVMPFVMILFLKTTSSDFLEPLMTTTYGHVIMTIALAMIIAGLLIGRKIMRIEV
jgi:tight adherence protein B